MHFRDAVSPTPCRCTLAFHKGESAVGRKRKAGTREKEICYAQGLISRFSSQTHIFTWKTHAPVRGRVPNSRGGNGSLESWDLIDTNRRDYPYIRFELMLNSLRDVSKFPTFLNRIKKPNRSQSLPCGRRFKSLLLFSEVFLRVDR